MPAHPPPVHPQPAPVMPSSNTPHPPHPSPSHQPPPPSQTAPSADPPPSTSTATSPPPTDELLKKMSATLKAHLASSFRDLREQQRQDADFRELREWQRQDTNVLRLCQKLPVPAFAGARSSTLRSWMLSLTLACFAALSKTSAAFSM